jgi:hypothetical protein
MNALFLKDLADKVRRGLRGRIEDGKSGGGNSSGYDVVGRSTPSASRFAASAKSIRPKPKSSKRFSPVMPAAPRREKSRWI